LQGVAKKHDLYSKAKFGHEVTNASWDELTKTWKVIVHDIIRNRTEELTYDIMYKRRTVEYRRGYFIRF
jgi:cation diffusion facilitator CzcD-associated flavoprotein CzcO